MELHALDNLIHDSLPAEHGKVLDDLHVVDILLKQLPGHIGQPLGNAGLLGIFQLLSFFLNFLSCPSAFIWATRAEIEASSVRLRTL